MEEENLDAVLQHALLALLDVKPRDPINFLATHFQMECETSNLVAKTVHILKDMTIEHAALEERLLKAYSTVSQYNEEDGLTGEIYTDLLAKLVVDLPGQQKDKFLQHMQCHSTEYVSFPVFKSGVITCILFNQFIDESKSLFSSLCNEGHDYAPAGICRKALKKLSKSISQSQKESAKAQETQAALGISDLNISVKKPVTKGSPPKEFMKINAFLSEATDVYLQEISKIK